MKQLFSLFSICLLLGTALHAESITESITTYVKNQPQPITAFQLVDAFEKMTATDPAYGTPVTFVSDDLDRVRMAALDSSRFAVMYEVDNQGLLVVGQVSPSNTISFGTAAVFAGDLNDLAIDAMGTDKLALAYRLAAGQSFVQMATISGTTVIFGTAVQFATSTLDLGVAAFDDAVVVSYFSNNDLRGRVESFAVSGTTVTEVSEIIFNYASTGFTTITRLGTNDFVIAYADIDNEGFGTVINGSIDASSGEILRLGNEVVFEAQEISRTRIRNLDDTRFLIAYHIGAGFFVDNPLNVVVGQINTTKTQILQMGTPVNVASPDTDGFAITVTDANTFVINYSEPNNPSGDVISLSGDISGTAITGFSNPVTVLTDQTVTAFNFVIDLVTVGDKFVMAFDNENANPDNAGDNTGDVILGTLDGTVLPVSIASFEGEQVEESVKLSWQTVIEQNNEGFEVQRRGNDGEWTTLDFVEGHGTMMEPIRYTYTDKNPLPGINYYRLRQVDYDGASDYSETIAVAYVSETTDAPLLVYPNPVTDGTLYLDLPDAEGAQKTIHIYTTAGQLVLHSTLTDNALSVSDLPPGMYVLQVSVGGASQSAWLKVE